ncbi:MAG: xanthine dehydrogenase family protein molybdopterin-binding subunit, partial [Rhodospirillales bacterium]|nr:xanthine dehydrogenase family protein molybdopterin-binding subunit [Rhodospirillales bacterium]
MTSPADHGHNYHYVSKKRRTKEDRRFITGKGQYVADVKLPGMLHVALVSSPHPRANIRGVDASAALALPGVAYVLTGDELSAGTTELFHGLDVPNVRWFPLAVGMTRYAGEWVAAVVAESRYVAEDAAELVMVDYEPLPAAIDTEHVMDADAPLVHPDHGSNVLLHKKFVWGPVDDDFAAADHNLSYRARWGRSSTVPIETFGVVARWDDSHDILDVWASIQMPNYPEQIAGAIGIPVNSVRVHNDVDVGGSYGVKRGIKHTVLVSYLCRKLGAPVRLIEDRLDNMAGGDAHGPDRIFDVDLAFDNDGTVRSMRLRALDDVGAYPGRAPLQLGKPITALCGPYRVNSIAYEAMSVLSNKTGQVPVRGFGQSPTNFMTETGIEHVAAYLGMDRLEVRRRNLIEAHQFPWTNPTGNAYDSGDYHAVVDKAMDLAGYDELIARRDAIRARGGLAGIGIATCLEPGGGNNIFERLLNDKLNVTTFVEACQIRVDAQGTITAIMGTTTSGQG